MMFNGTEIKAFLKWTEKVSTDHVSRAAINWSVIQKKVKQSEAVIIYDI